MPSYVFGFSAGVLDVDFFGVSWQPKVSRPSTVGQRPVYI
jgi:hypothetical protein